MTSYNFFKVFIPYMQQKVIGIKNFILNLIKAHGYFLSIWTAHQIQINYQFTKVFPAALHFDKYRNIELLILE